MLFLAAFVKEQRHRIFLFAYCFVMLVSKDVRTILDSYIDTSGMYFFEYYSNIQFILIVVSIVLLKSWIRIASVMCLLMFSLYSYCIFVWWGHMSIEWYDSIAIGVVFFHMFLVSYKESNTKNLLILVVTGCVTAGRARYL